MKFKKFTHKIIFAFSLATLPLSSFFAQNQMDLPVTFELATTDYGLAGFGGAELSTIEVDPTDPTNTVAKVIKSNTAATWAGTTITDVGNLGFATPIPFVSGATSMSLRVWSPDAGIQIRMKVEDHTNAGISVETEATTTVAGQWETLTFNFANQAAGTATINLANNYDKASVFFNFGVDGATAGTKTYYFDDLTYVSGGGLNQMDLPVTFELANTDYGLAGFGGAELSTIEVDPTDPTNTVAKVIKSNTAATWAGTTITNASNSGLASPIPFASGATSMSLRVWSPDAGIQVRLKVEDYTNPGITVETEATTTAAGQWQTLTFDFSNQAAGTATLNLANNYNKASVFFNFGVDGATAGTKTYYFDDLTYVSGGGLNQMDLPVTFELANTDYGLAGFGGAELSTIEVDPTDPTNTVAKVIKSNIAATWAGTTITNASNSGLASPIPFASGATSMSLKVWSPDAGIQVRLKVEDYTNPGISVETEATTTAAGQWQTLTFDFANQAAGTAAINLANNYNKASVFFNFGVDGATAGTKTYYFDNLSMAAGASGLNLNIDVCNVNATSVRITGPWWNWDPNGGPIASDNGDGTWTVNLNPTPTADMEYLVVVNSVQENLISDMQNGGTCAPVTDYFAYANRKWVVGSGDVNINYDRCVPCEYPDLVITTEICDTADQVNLTGPIWGWNPAFGPQAVDNGDGTWTFTISPAPKDTLEYLLVKDGVVEDLIIDMVNGGGCAPITDYANYANRRWIIGQGAISNTYDQCGPCGLGFEEFSLMDVAIYPNPTNEMLTLTSSKAIEKIEIYSMVGDLVLSADANNFVVELNLTALEAGLYTLNVHGANGVKTTRIVKN